MDHEFNDDQYLWYPHPHCIYPYHDGSRYGYPFIEQGHHSMTVFNQGEVRIAVVFYRDTLDNQ